jgi:hypothetical protein
MLETIHDLQTTWTQSVPINLVLLANSAVSQKKALDDLIRAIAIFE